MKTIGRLSILLAVGLAGLPGAARGQDAAPARGAAASAGAPETSNGLAPRRNKRVAGAELHPARAAAAAIPAAGPELAVTAAVAATVDPEPAGRMNVRLLDRDITTKFALLDHCRTAVTRSKPPALIANTLTLRWTIPGKGQVAAMDVIGSTPVYPGVLDCIERDTNGWLFTSPVGGEVRLNRALVFRRLSPPPPRP